MKTSLKRILVLFAATALWTGGAIAEDDPIVLGIPVGLSGANSIVARSMVQAAELAVFEIDAAGGSGKQKARH